MANPNFVLLYVDSPKASADLLRRPARTPAGRVLADLRHVRARHGVMLGLWSHAYGGARRRARPAAAPRSPSPSGAGAVDATCADWSGRGLPSLQEPTDMDFGRTFVALDPDGHRLRVFAPVRGGRDNQ